MNAREMVAVLIVEETNATIKEVFVDIDCIPTMIAILWCLLNLKYPGRNVNGEEIVANIMDVMDMFVQR